MVDLFPDGGVVPGALQCWLLEGAGCEADAYAPGEGAITIACLPCPGGGGGGRRGSCARARGERDERGGRAYLASLAFEEDASVAAFERMREELEALGAPASLVDAAARAAEDEVRHARVMTRLARARGGRVTRARATGRGAWRGGDGRGERGRGVRARDVRRAPRAMAERVARATSSFAACSRGSRRTKRVTRRCRGPLARWLEPQLDAEGRARVARSRARALRALERSLDAEPAASVAAEAGVPTASQARALLRGMARELGIAPVTRAARR